MEISEIAQSGKSVTSLRCGKIRVMNTFSVSIPYVNISFSVFFALKLFWKLYPTLKFIASVYYFN